MATEIEERPQRFFERTTPLFVYEDRPAPAPTLPISTPAQQRRERALAQHQGRRIPLERPRRRRKEANDAQDL